MYLPSHFERRALKRCTTTGPHRLGRGCRTGRLDADHLPFLIEPTRRRGPLRGHVAPPIPVAEVQSARGAGRSGSCGLRVPIVVPSKCHHR